MLRRAFIVATVAAAVAGCSDQATLISPPAHPRAAIDQFIELTIAPVVTSLADDGDGTCTITKCTLRDAIAYAGTGATITFGESLTSGGPASIPLTVGQLLISKDLTINGPGADKLTVTRSAAANLRIFAIGAGSTVGISGLSITGGNFGGLEKGGGVYNEGTLTLSDCVVANNSNLFATIGGGIANELGGTLTLARCTVSRNSALAVGGISNEGTMTIVNSTVVDNSAFSIGGIANFGGTLTITQSTIARNSGSLNPAGISGPATIRSSIVAKNATGVVPVLANCDPGQVTDGGYNIEDGTTCGFTGTGSQQATDPKLDVGLASNGGPTPTNALLSTSPAIDLIPSGVNGCGTTIKTDQRSFTRPTNTKCDAGAFEFGATSNQPPVASAGGPYTANEGSAVTLSLSATDPNNDALTYNWNFGDGTTGSGSTPPTSHAYGDNGVYTITLTATDPGGLADTKTATATIFNVAPSITTFTGPTDPKAVGTSVSASGAFVDAGPLDTHTASIDWGDSGNSAGSVTESSGSGTFSGSHTYAAPGVYTVTATVTDDDGGVATRTFQYVVVYDPTGAFVTGGGWIVSPAGAYAPNPALAGKATFGFISRYQKGTTTPSGTTRFEFSVGNLVFDATSYEWLVVSGPQVQFKGQGTINGGGHYGFLITANDGSAKGGGGTDTFRIKIWDMNTMNVVYDNGANAPLGGGNVSIH